LVLLKLAFLFGNLHGLRFISEKKSLKKSGIEERSQAKRNEQQQQL
jgi:hypothetical protein